ncbi:hypothetical protein RDWZM_002852 [Blomia tropicalis]|uniref:YEATS domain-containing protein n=1 Tax=Blomia tropicalis TaxID=40697 RepID=A0A9Q0MH40_BLOTA|nr:YEATS domain-containing protein 4 [Blomia tropicalis]KAJ6224307.1 hypothetical protein RDWZM_002852 [Blomia tropicalis]
MSQVLANDISPVMKGKFLVKPIVYGNNARKLPLPIDKEGHTHRWCVYLKSYNNEDMSAYIKKVTFKLHETYPTPTRVCTEPPYKVTETGWGEFEVVIKIFLHDSSDSRPIVLTHLLKLFPPPPHTGEYWVSESYDELIYGEPTEEICQRWESARKLPPSVCEPIETDFEAKRVKTLESLIKAKNWVRADIEDYRKRIEQAKEEIVKYKDIIKKREKSEILNTN